MSSVAKITNGNFYENVKSIVNDCVKVDNLELDYFSGLFRGLFAFYFIVFSIFILHISLKFFVRRKHWFRIALNGCKFELIFVLLLLRNNSLHSGRACKQMLFMTKILFYEFVKFTAPPAPRD